MRLVDAGWSHLITWCLNKAVDVPYLHVNVSHCVSRDWCDASTQSRVQRRSEKSWASGKKTFWWRHPGVQRVTPWCCPVPWFRNVRYGEMWRGRGCYDPTNLIFSQLNGLSDYVQPNLSWKELSPSKGLRPAGASGSNRWLITPMFWHLPTPWIE